jgi:hypothetical protein
MRGDENRAINERVHAKMAGSPSSPAVDACPTWLLIVIVMLVFILMTFLGKMWDAKLHAGA